MEDNPDFITLMPCTNAQRSIVVRMTWSQTEDSYVIRSCSEPLSNGRAAARLEAIAAYDHLEIR